MKAPGSYVKGRALVTGASGFIGKRVVAALSGSGYGVIAVQHQGERLAELSELCERVIIGDICDPSVQDDALRDVDIVCHAAAYIPRRHDDPEEAERCYRVNALATLHLASLSVKRNIRRFVYLSAGNMYSLTGKPCSETDSAYPSGPAAYYLSSKLLGELYLMHVCGTSGAIPVSLRVGTPYGPGEPANKVVTAFMLRASRGEPLRVASGGTAKFNFVYIDDVANCVVSAIENGPAGIYNVSSAESASLRTMAETVASIYDDRRVVINIEPETQGSFPGFAAISIDKARATWGYSPLSLLEGLGKYREYLDGIDGV